MSALTQNYLSQFFIMQNVCLELCNANIANSQHFFFQQICIFQWKFREDFGVADFNILLRKYLNIFHCFLILVCPELPVESSPI